MGNYCTRCNCNIFEEDEKEMIINESGVRPKIEAALAPKGGFAATKKQLKFKSEADIMRYVKGNGLQKIIRLQAFWKGYQIRRVIKYLIATQKSLIKYFTQEEARETLSKSKFNPKQILEKRKPYQYKSGAVYTGEWRGGFREGYGEIKWPDGAIYRGTWKFGRAHGKGTFNHADGDVYEGQWAYDKANGYGKYTHNNGAKYEGYWKDDVQHGRGKEKWEDGAQYDGEYSYGKKHGHGTYCWKDGSKYSGEWEENNISGKGVYEWNDSRKFAGEWKNNNMNGFGMYSWPGGRKYIGFYVNDHKQGYGRYIWKDGRMFQGWWLEINSMDSESIQCREKIRSTGFGRMGNALYGFLQNKFRKLPKAFSIILHFFILQRIKRKLKQDKVSIHLPVSSISSNPFRSNFQRLQHSQKSSQYSD